MQIAARLLAVKVRAAENENRILTAGSSITGRAKGVLLVSYLLFIDVSVNPQQRVGVGACLLLPQQFPDSLPQEIVRAELAGQLLCRRFTDTSSSKLELQTVLWGLEIYRARVSEPLRDGLQLYTDSQCVVGLSARRESLEENAYRSGRSGQLLANASLYGEFYAAKDELGFEIVKVAGHSRAAQHDSVQRIFSVVDREARRELKLWLALPEAQSGRQSGAGSSCS